MLLNLIMFMHKYAIIFQSSTLVYVESNFSLALFKLGVNYNEIMNVGREQCLSLCCSMDVCKMCHWDVRGAPFLFILATSILYIKLFEYVCCSCRASVICHECKCGTEWWLNVCSCRQKPDAALLQVSFSEMLLCPQHLSSWLMLNGLLM